MWVCFLLHWRIQVVQSQRVTRNALALFRRIPIPFRPHLLVQAARLSNLGRRLIQPLCGVGITDLARASGGAPPTFTRAEGRLRHDRRRHPGHLHWAKVKPHPDAHLIGSVRDLPGILHRTEGIRNWVRLSCPIALETWSTPYAAWFYIEPNWLCFSHSLSAFSRPTRAPPRPWLGWNRFSDTELSNLPGAQCAL